jgi:drug/metabolite transporter (DMT)-like permease
VAHHAPGIVMSVIVSRVQSFTNQINISRGMLLMLFGTFAGAWASIFGRIAQQEGVPTTSIVAYRMILGALVLTPFVLQNHRHELRRLRRRDVLITAFAGIWFGIHLVFNFESFKHTSILVSGVLAGTAPLWIALLETRILRTKLNRMVWLGLIITLLGGVIITLSGRSDMNLGDNPLLGSALALGAAICGAFYTITGRGTKDSISFLPYIWMLFIFGGLTGLVSVGITHAPMTGFTPKAYFALVMLTILPQLIGHVVYNYSLRQLPATFVSVIGQSGIIISATLAYFIFQEVPHILQMPGSIAILIGIMMVNLNKPRTGSTKQREITTRPD